MDAERRILVDCLELLAFELLEDGLESGALLVGEAARELRKPEQPVRPIDRDTTWTILGNKHRL